jgi:hypothetical protein
MLNTNIHVKVGSTEAVFPGYFTSLVHSVSPNTFRHLEAFYYTEGWFKVPQKNMELFECQNGPAIRVSDIWLPWMRLATWVERQSLEESVPQHAVQLSGYGELVGMGDHVFSAAKLLQKVSEWKANPIREILSATYWQECLA